MSVTMAQIDRRVDSAQELESVTHTMKGMAAVSVRHFERAADAMGIYESTLDRGLQVVARHLDADDVAWERHSRFPPRRSAVIVFGSNQGLCGPVNRQVARHAAEVVAACPTSVFEVVAVGFRLSSELELTGVPPDVVLELPNSVDGISPRQQNCSYVSIAGGAPIPTQLFTWSFPASAGVMPVSNPLIARCCLSTPLVSVSWSVNLGQAGACPPTPSGVPSCSQRWFANRSSLG